MTRKEQAVATRKRIIEATYDLIAERGYLNITVDDIAAACGIGRGTLYNYFSGKEDILIYIERGRYQEIWQMVEDMGLKTAEEKLRRFILIWFQCVHSDNVNVAKDWHRLAVELKIPSKENRTHLDDDIENIAEYFKEGIRLGELREDMPVLPIAKSIVFSMYGASFYRCSSYTQFDLATWAQEFVRDVLELHIAPFRMPHS